MSSLSRHLALAGALLLAGPLAALPPAVGEALPPFAGQELEGRLPNLAGQVALVDFWASWCRPCRASFPALARLHAEFTPRGVVIVGIGVDRDAAAHAAFLRRQAPPFATVRDPAQRYVAAVGVPAMPTTYVLGRDGRIRSIHVGFRGADSERALRAALIAALAEAPTP